MFALRASCVSHITIILQGSEPPNSLKEFANDSVATNSSPRWTIISPSIPSLNPLSRAFIISSLRSIEFPNFDMALKTFFLTYLSPKNTANNIGTISVWRQHFTSAAGLFTHRNQPIKNFQHALYEIAELFAERNGRALCATSSPSPIRRRGSLTYVKRSLACCNSNVSYVRKADL